MNCSIRLLITTLVLSLCMGSVGSADEVDEAAKCTATFRVLTSLARQNEELGQHFTKLTHFSNDLMARYSQLYRNTNMTNGQASELTSHFQLLLDAASSDGSAFLPYVKSCTGWLIKVLTLVNEANHRQDDIELTLRSAPTPNLSFKYPHADWAKMQSMFLISHEIWSDMGKVTPRDIRKALSNTR
jgi:hypothetical protein